MRKFLFFLLLPVLLRASFSDAGVLTALIELDPILTARGFTGFTSFESMTSSYSNPALLALKGTYITYINEQCKIPLDYIYTFISPIPRQPPWLSSLLKDMRVYYYEYALRPFSEKLWRFSPPVVSFYRFKGVYGKFDAYSFGGEYLGSWVKYDEIKAIGAATSIDSMILIGFKVKYFDSFIIPEDIAEKFLGEKGGRSTGFWYDAGGIFNTQMGIRYGVSLLNYGDSVKYFSHERYLPPTIIRQEISFNTYDFVNFLSQIIDDDKLPRLNHILGFSYSKGIWSDIVGQEHELWKGRGYELNLLNTFFIRKGFFDDRVGSRTGKTGGFGFRVGNIMYNFANDNAIYSFPQDKNWRVSLTITDDTTAIKPLQKLIGRENTAVLMGVLAPGGGHFVIGKKYRGTLFFALTNLLIKAAEKNKGLAQIALATAGVGVYLGSLFDLDRYLPKNTHK